MLHAPSLQQKITQQYKVYILYIYLHNLNKDFVLSPVMFRVSQPLKTQLGH